MKRWGFTLVELLTVIGIILILSAALFPVLAQARDTARSSACLSSSRQLALASALYSEDYEKTPVLWRDLSPQAATYIPPYPGWAQRLYSYVKNSPVYYCPSGPACVPAHILDGVLGGAGPNRAGNAHLGSGRFLGEMEDPARLILLAETGVNDWSGDGVSVRSADTMEPWTAKNDRVALKCQQLFDAYDPYNVSRRQAGFAIHWRHHGRANFLFADGHARSKSRGTLLPENLYPNAIPEQALTPCPDHP